MGVFVYLGLLILGVLIVLLVQRVGSGLGEAATNSMASSTSPRVPVVHLNIMLHVLGTMTTVILLGAFLGYLCRFVGQPPVIGEVLAGLALGPSLLGAISPDCMHLLVPAADVDPKGLVNATLKVISQLGIVLYMFLVGLELNAAYLKQKAQAAIAISHASIVAPFVLGSVLSLWLYPLVSEPHVSFTSFSLFMGVAMSITAFPVLARILTDRNLQGTHVGSIALSCAAADDVSAWCLLSLVVGVTNSEMNNVIFVSLGSLLFIAVMLWIVRPLFIRFTPRLESGISALPNYVVSAIYVFVLAAAFMTEWIGIHAIFGAFLLGVIIPSESKLAHSFLTKLKEPVTVLLLPAFFAYTGMRTEIGLLNSWSQWGICLAIIMVATLGKFGGTILAARVTGETWRNASVLGILMNTRGLMELIVLNIGLDLKVIGPNLFAMMVIMALVTTMVTSPIVQHLMPTPSHEKG